MSKHTKKGRPTTTPTDAREVVAHRKALELYMNTLIDALGEIGSRDPRERDAALRKLRQTSHQHETLVALASTFDGEWTDMLSVRVTIHYGDIVPAAVVRQMMAAGKIKSPLA